MGNEMADEEAKTASTMHPGKVAGSTSPAGILLNKHVMPSPAGKGIAKARPQRLTADAHSTSWLSYDTPLWHNNYFRNQQAQTYFCPQLIQAGVLTVGQLLEDDSSFQLIATTWRGVYQTALGGNTDPPRCPDQPARSKQKGLATPGAKPWPPLFFWCDWTHHQMIEFLSTSSPPESKHTLDVWATLARGGLPTRTISYPRLFGKSSKRGNANELGNPLIHVAPLITPWKQSHTACTNAPLSNMLLRSSMNASRWTFHICSLRIRQPHSPNPLVFWLGPRFTQTGSYVVPSKNNKPRHRRVRRF